MTAADLRAELAGLDRQKAQLIDALKQIDGAIGFCRGVVAKAEKAEADAAAKPEVPQTAE